MAVRALRSLNAPAAAFFILAFAGPFARADSVRLLLPPGADSLALPQATLLVGSDTVFTRAATLVRDRDYFFAPDFSALRLAMPAADTVFVHYATLPGADATVRRFAPLDRPPATDAAIPAAGPAMASLTDERLEIMGSKKLSLGIGQGGGLIEQSLSLSIRGELGPQLNIEGTITDRGTPTDAITRRPSEFDKISLRAWGPGFESEFGDTELRQDDFRLFNLSRRLSGMRAAGAYRSVHGAGLFGRRRGEFRSRRFYGEEGRQGPYALATANRIAVVPGSEAVWLDGEQMEFGADRDYQIDYPTGTLTFSPRRPITRESRITVDYEIAADAYNSYVYEAGAGVAQGGWQLDWLLHREWDDPASPRGLTLLDSDRAALAAAGDSAAAAVRSGVDSVGAGNGSYARDSAGGYFVYAGPGDGEFNVIFSFVGPGGGDYRARGDGSYFFAGSGLGDYAPVIALPLPGESDLLALRGGRTWGAHALAFEWVQSDNDPNRLSSLNDGDNRGSAWLGRYEFGGTDTRVGATAHWQHRDAHFAAPGRDLAVEYDRQWGDVLGSRPQTENQFGAGLRYGTAAAGARVDLDVRDREQDAAWRASSDFAFDRFGAWQGHYERLRRDDSLSVDFDAGRLGWRTPLAPLPVAWQFSGERRVAGAGSRFGEAELVVGPPRLSGTLAYRRTDSLTSGWLKASDLYRAGATWRHESSALDGSAHLTLEQRRYVQFQSGREERLLAESRWLWRQGDFTARLDYQLSREGSRSQNEQFVPVEAGRGDYREENGQYIPDPLGDLVRVVQSSAFGPVARQSTKRANVVWQPVRSTLRLEVDVAATETAADADLPPPAWLLPWQVEAGSPTRQRSWQAEFSGGGPAVRWVSRLEWQRRVDLRASRPEDFRRVAGEGTLRLRLSEALRFENRLGAGTERERELFPYDFTFALAGTTPAWRFGRRGEISAPLFWQRYWRPGGELLADWQRAGVRGVWRLAERGRIVAEPTLVHVQAHASGVPLSVAEGRAPGTSAEWRLEGSLDFSGTLVGRLIYRGRAEADRPPVHRADISVEASF